MPAIKAGLNMPNANVKLLGEGYKLKSPTCSGALSFTKKLNNKKQTTISKNLPFNYFV